MLKDINTSEHYKWGENCDGWHLVKWDTLSIIQEKMPARTYESAHYHEHAQQFFYILKGTARFEIDGESYELSEGQGIHIFPKQKHRILNNTDLSLEFTVTSQPKSHGDRIEL